MMIDAKKIISKAKQYKILKVPMIVLLSLFAINILFYIIFLFPLKRSTAVKGGSYLALKSSINQKAQYKRTKEDIAEFYKTIPEKTDFTKIINFISNSAKKNGLKMPAITYQQEKSEKDAKKKMLEGDLEKTALLFSVQGGYEGIRRLIYEIESAKYFLIIEDMNLQKKDDKIAGAITLQMKVAAYTR